MDDTMDDIYEEHNPNKEHKTMIQFDDMIAEILSNKRTSTNSNRIIILFICFSVVVFSKINHDKC